MQWGLSWVDDREGRQRGKRVKEYSRNLAAGERDDIMCKSQQLRGLPSFLSLSPLPPPLSPSLSLSLPLSPDDDEEEEGWVGRSSF